MIKRFVDIESVTGTMCIELVTIFFFNPASKKNYKDQDKNVDKYQ